MPCRLTKTVGYILTSNAAFAVIRPFLLVTPVPNTGARIHLVATCAPVCAIVQQPCSPVLLCWQTEIFNMTVHYEQEWQKIPRGVDGSA